MVTSSAVVGSSAMMTLGLQASAMAIITRWRMPPENSCGYCLNRRSGSVMPTLVSSSMARALRLRRRHVEMLQHRLDDLPADGQQRVERRHRLLEDHRDLAAAEASHRFLGQREVVLAGKAGRAGEARVGAVGEEPHHGERRDRLAAAGFADQRDDLARAARRS